MTSRRNTTFAVVERLVEIKPHPDPIAQRIEIIVLSSGVELVTGKHYRAGDRGVYLRPGCLIPGWLAEQLWMVGKKRASAWFEVRDIPIGVPHEDGTVGPKVQSPGLWCGEWYKNDSSDESTQRARELLEHGGYRDAQGFIHWWAWREEWREGFTLDGHFGIVEAVEPERVVTTAHDPGYIRKKRRLRAIARSENRSVVQLIDKGMWPKDREGHDLSGENLPARP